MGAFVYRTDVKSLPAAFQPFRFNGGALPLHLVETVHEWDADCIDRIDGPESWNRWLTSAEQVVPGIDIDEAGLVRMRELREAIALVARAIVGQREVSPTAITSINAFAITEIPGPLLALGSHGLVAIKATSVTHDHLFAKIAREAVALFGGPRARSIRLCAEPACPTLFVDNSPSGSKVWCSTACGTRAASRAYRGRRASSALSVAEQ